jgi:hypothetical protein
LVAWYDTHIREWKYTPVTIDGTAAAVCGFVNFHYVID